MSSLTERLKLLMKDPIADGNEPFNIETILNDNWRLIDELVALRSEVPTATAVQQQIDTAIAELISGAPGALDTLNELAAALGDDPNFATTILNRLSQIKEGATTHSADYVKHSGFVTTTNSGNAYAATLTPAPAAYVNGMGVAVIVTADATGAVTLNVNGLGAKPIKKANGNDVTNLKANGVYTVRYNSAANSGAGAFILQGEGGSMAM